MTGGRSHPPMKVIGQAKGTGSGSYVPVTVPFDVAAAEAATFRGSQSHFTSPRGRSRPRGPDEGFLLPFAVALHSESTTLKRLFYLTTLAAGLFLCGCAPSSPAEPTEKAESDPFETAPAAPSTLPPRSIATH